MFVGMVSICDPCISSTELIGRALNISAPTLVYEKKSGPLTLYSIDTHFDLSTTDSF